MWDPAWYHSKSALYVLELAPEVLLLGMFILVRVDRRFHALTSPQQVVAASTEKEVVAQACSVGMTTPGGSKSTSVFRERHVSETPPLIPEICYSSPI